ncbi:MAG TPA: type III pantothenate kinase [Clostridia bacterium]|jgi:type III pantothenate kinase|nr:type III pantothenate kinase [Clostridia bacterium]HRU84300.1 type III pantothenate kinase [Eubacteriales bacterium]
MLLVMDIGNTNVKIGLFKTGEPELFASWRISTLASRTSDEFGMIIFDLFKSVGIEFSDIKGIIISSVAPTLNYTIEHTCLYYLGLQPIFVDHLTDTGIKIKYDHPVELGADRIVGAAAAYHIYGGPCIVVDFGSATTFNIVDDKGVFLGGAIAPGLKVASESLTNTAAKLPRIELISPKSAIATNTVEGMQAGVILGYTGLVDYMLKRIKRESGLDNAKIIATGGLSELIKLNEPGLIDVIDRPLALKGLKLIYERITAQN